MELEVTTRIQLSQNTFLSLDSMLFMVIRNDEEKNS